MTSTNALNEPYPGKLDIVEDGKQTTKVFFLPQIHVTDETGTRILPSDWAGRILPGQTIDEGIAAELKDVYDYEGEFTWNKPAFHDWATDKKGRRIQRYSIDISIVMNSPRTSVEDDAYPALQPKEFGDELLGMLHSQRQKMNLSDDTMCSLILRYDNSWIGSLFYNEDNDDLAYNLSERIAMEAKCPIVDGEYQKPISDQISASHSSPLPENIMASLDYSKSAQTEVVGNVTVAFILTPINPDGSIKRLS